MFVFRDMSVNARANDSSLHMPAKEILLFCTVPSLFSYFADLLAIEIQTCDSSVRVVTVEVGNLLKLAFARSLVKLTYFEDLFCDRDSNM